MEIQAIKSNKGYYLRKQKGPYSLLNLIFNDNLKVEATFSPEWFFLPSAPIKIQVLEPAKQDNWRFVLKDVDLANKFQLEYSRSAVMTDSFEFTPEFESIKGLYENKFDVLPERLVDLEFKILQIAEIEELEKPTFSYKTVPTWDRRYKDTEVTEQDVRYNFISKIVTPDLIFPLKQESKDQKKCLDI